MTNKSDDEQELELFGAMKRIENMNRKRGHATCWHAENEFQGPMEVFATRCWAEEMNKRGRQIDIDTIRKNPETYPDCLAEMDGEKIGIEVTELVDEEAIDEHPKIPPLVVTADRPGSCALDKLPQPMPPGWPLDKFERCLNKRVQRKDERVKDGSLSKQFLLIVTCEPWLDEATLSAYLKTIELQRPQNFDGVYIMGSYMPDPDGEGHYPAFEVAVAG